MTVAENALACGTVAAGRLAPYDAAIAANFEIPLHIGRLIAAWDRPMFVPADRAGHMREDDYVVGLEYKGHFRAYPLWVTDNYHMINDRIAGDPVLFSTCERCQSGSAFVSRLDGEDTKFSAMGMYNASLTMVNRKGGTADSRSLWLHYEGVAIDGPLKGRFLEQIPTYHTTWKAWASAHPQTDVMLAPDDPHHRDARHGHGREEYFCRPGMDPPLAKTITGRFDHRYPENEIVLAINIDAGIRAYPLLEVKREGGVLNDELGELPILVLCGPRPEQATMSAFWRVMDDRALTFEPCQEDSPAAARDRQTESLWTIEGRAIAGPLKGRRLEPLRWQYVRWHAWAYPHPTTDLFLGERTPPRYPHLPPVPQVEALNEVLQRLSGLGRELTFSHVVPELALPHEATEGVCVYFGLDRLNLYAFTCPDAATDYVELQGAYFCMPFDTKVARKRARRIGRFVVESDPVEQYAEPTQTVHYPDNETSWSRLVLQDEDVSPGAGAKGTADGHFTALIRHLRQQHYDVVECAFLPHSQLRVGALSAIAATIEGDRFAVYRCVSEEAAADVATEVTHAIHVGTWVLRSIPVLMYADPRYEMGQLPDDKIEWSPLLRDDGFISTLQKFSAGHL